MFLGLWRYAAFVAAIMLFSSMASATSTWTGIVDNNWSNGNNWSGGGPLNADVVFQAFGGGGTKSSNNDLSSVVLNSLTINGRYSMTGNAVTLGSTTPGTGNLVVSFSVNSIAFDIALGGAAGSTQFISLVNDGSATLSGHLSGSAGLAVSKSGSGFPHLILTGDNNGFTGPFTINSGEVDIGNASALGATTLPATVQAGAQLRLFDVANPIAKNLVINGQPDLTGALFSEHGTNTVSGGILLDSDTRIGAIGSLTLSGQISDSGAGHNLALEAAGNGSVIILGRAGGNTYRGTTTLASINGGAVVITNTSGSATGTGPVVITSGTLRGNGIISGTVSLNSGAALDPGLFSGGGMATGALTWNGGGELDMKLGADASGSDRLNLSGALLKGSAGAYKFQFDTVNAVPGNVYELIDFTSTTFALSDFSYNPQLTGYFSFDSVSAPTQLLFTVVNPAPEPGSLLLLSLSLAGLAIRRSRKRGLK